MVKANPFSLMIDSWQLGVEAWMVIALRIPKLLAGNSAAAREAHLMVAEKIEAVGALQWKALTGTLGTDPDAAMRNSIAHYRKAVARNQRRLSRRRK
ncbi:hypothetical protein FIM10_08940 [Sphingomonadales bacterium 56]|uniref:hypothetical protein n=1 Tax=unclassified Sphingobium TaxID=2611147 RepID=UPI00191B2C18|nr:MULTISPECIES: hypothetical protein [unclassified Sphingobium]MBY2928801.1 hypothetical protein [Sphingomonadales bacterium 56]MBY2959348.1 hypothetical protein [Sphingomonadales bacterium 58]CAD7338057.1 hypothetical protein SPHS6_01810 [Sphingobium sp. S6]CAD7338828.1 hypothetical protein SPHS8_02302 [Sphingobium sp. S8]